MRKMGYIITGKVDSDMLSMNRTKRNYLEQLGGKCSWRLLGFANVVDKPAKFMRDFD